MKIGIVGMGHVGTAMYDLFKTAIIYDKYKKIGDRQQLCDCDCVFVCVPTPMGSDGSCDTSAVDEVLEWLDSNVIVLRSTVPVGYTDRKSIELNKHIVFQPEYYGETVAHPFSNLNSRTWVTLGGEADARNMAISAYKTVYNADVQFSLVDAKTAELAKYMENAFLATKVTFCNEFYDIAEAYGIDYNQLRETWLCDPRIGRSHTFVYEDNRGFGGSCLPKDLSAIIHQANSKSVDASFLESVREKNKQYRNE